MLGAALRQKAPIVALHLTRPNVDIPDRRALGVAGDDPAGAVRMTGAHRDAVVAQAPE